MNDDMPMAVDEVIAIQQWLDEIKKSLKSESISWGELGELDNVYNAVKIFLE